MLGAMRLADSIDSRPKVACSGSCHQLPQTCFDVLGVPVADAVLLDLSKSTLCCVINALVLWPTHMYRLRWPRTTTHCPRLSSSRSSLKRNLTSPPTASKPQSGMPAFVNGTFSTSVGASTTAAICG